MNPIAAAKIVPMEIPLAPGHELFSDWVPEKTTPRMKNRTTTMIPWVIQWCPVIAAIPFMTGSKDSFETVSTALNTNMTIRERPNPRVYLLVN